MSIATAETNRKFFNNLADNYDNFLVRMDEENLLGNAILEFIDIRPGMTLLDIAIGTAYYSTMIARSVDKDINIVGVDISDGMLEKASERFRKEAMEDKVVLNNSNVEKIDFGRKFDRIFTSSAMRYFNDQQTIVKKIFNNLNKNGRAVIQEIRLPEDSNEFSYKMCKAFYPGLIKMEEMRSHMEQAGFHDIEFKHIDMVPNSRVDISSMREQMESTLDEEAKIRVSAIFREAMETGELERARETGIVFRAYIMKGEK